MLKGLINEIHFPQIFKYDKANKKIIKSLMGPNLKKLFIRCGSNKFPEKTVANIGIEVLKRLKNLHNKGIQHRDIKPENLCWGYFSSNKNENKKSIILIDFDLSEYYLNSNGNHYEYKKKSEFVGTLKYSLLNTINYRRQSRRDDLEALIYVLIYFLKGYLPWEDHLDLSSKEEFNYFKNQKEKYSIAPLCCDIPREFGFLFENIRNLGFDSTPDYDIYINILEKFIEKNINKFGEEDYKFIWKKKLFIFIIIVLKIKNLDH